GRMDCKVLARRRAQRHRHHQPRGSDARLGLGAWQGAAHVHQRDGVVVSLRAADVADHGPFAAAADLHAIGAQAGMGSRPASFTSVPSMASSVTVWSPSRVTSARLPSGVMATPAGTDLSGSAMRPVCRKRLPSTANDHTAESVRVTTNTSLP